jgi:hypothetical protein
MSKSELVAALSIAFCYMPEEIELTEKDYGENLQDVKDDVAKIRKILVENGVDPDEIYNKINPVRE